MKNNFPGGVWPTMITPLTTDNKVDYNALKTLIEWYIKEGVSGLFSVCQSSEMFLLSLEERISIASFVKEKAAGRVPVIASGHISDSYENQVLEVNEIAKTGVDAVILITNRLAKENEGDEIWIENLKKLIDTVPIDIPLGFYEYPYPYKREMSPFTIKWCADNGRFFFLKDTSCDIDKIKEKLKVIEGTNFKLYNANTATLLESLKIGAAGYSGIMANFQSSLYAWLCNNYNDEKAEKLSDELTICALIERQIYPVNAKYYLSLEGIKIETQSRTKDSNELTKTYMKEVKMLNRVTKRMKKELNL